MDCYWDRFLTYITALNYAFVGVGLAMSAVFLFRNLYVQTSCSSHHRKLSMLILENHRYPVVSAIDAKPSRILLIVVVILHAGLAIAIKILFFAHGSPVTKIPATPSDPMQDPPKGDAGGDSRMFF